MPPKIIRYKKVVNTGLDGRAIRFTQADHMGHRIKFWVPKELMNKYFIWTRSANEKSPTGRFVPNPPSTIPFYDLIVSCLANEYIDQDGVRNGLDFSSAALEQRFDLKRNQRIPSPPGTNTHYSANDLVMAYVLYKCYGRTCIDTDRLVYNLADAYNMLTNEQVAQAIVDSFNTEETFATAAISPSIAPNLQNPNTNKGLVDAMFRNFLALDPLRYYNDCGKQIPGLFEISTDVDASGSWQLGPCDAIEIPLRFVFRGSVKIASYVDNLDSGSWTSSAFVQKTVIFGQDKEINIYGDLPFNTANMFSVRLQFMCT
jgi:hypothetical protein